MIAQIIQIAITPVFVLVAIASILNFLTTRLGRVVDRSRELRTLHGNTEGMEHDMVVDEIRVLARRIDLVGRAMLMMVLSGLSIGSTVIILFIGGLLDVAVDRLAATTFIVSIGLLLAGLIVFLLETREASASLRIPENYLELDRNR